MKISKNIKRLNLQRQQGETKKSPVSKEYAENILVHGLKTIQAFAQKHYVQMSSHIGEENRRAGNKAFAWHRRREEVFAGVICTTACTPSRGLCKATGSIKNIYTSKSRPLHVKILPTRLLSEPCFFHVCRKRDVKHHFFRFPEKRCCKNREWPIVFGTLTTELNQDVISSL